MTKKKTTAVTGPSSKVVNLGPSDDELVKLAQDAMDTAVGLLNQVKGPQKDRAQFIAGRVKVRSGQLKGE